MQVLNELDCKICEIVQNYTSVKKSQLIRMFPPEQTKRRLDILKDRKIIAYDGDFVVFTERAGKYKPNSSYLALELLLNFKDNIQYHCPQEYPFCMLMCMKDKTYDVTVIEPGQESIMSAIINRTQAERVIVFIKKLEQSKEVFIVNKEVMFAMFDEDTNDLNFYEPNSNRE